MPDAPSDSRTELRALTFLAPRLRGAYEAAATVAADALGTTARLDDGGSPSDLAGEGFELAFLCGLPYVGLRDAGADVEMLAAPAASEARYAGEPVYFSDIVVAEGSEAGSLADLRGTTLAFNERSSHSGWAALVARLDEAGEPAPFFSGVVETGGHDRSLAAVAEGRAAAAAIDSHVFDVAAAHGATAGLRALLSVGPFPAPGLVAGPGLDAGERALVRTALDQAPAAGLGTWRAVGDRDYDPVREVSRRSAGRGVA